MVKFTCCFIPAHGDVIFNPETVLDRSPPTSQQNRINKRFYKMIYKTSEDTPEITSYLKSARVSHYATCCVSRSLMTHLT